MGGVKIEAHVPFRTRALLMRGERKRLDEAMDDYGPAARITVLKLTRMAQASRRTVRGTHFEGTFEFKDLSGEDQNISAADLIRSEFPATFHDWGGVIEDRLLPVEFVLTPKYTVALFQRTASGSHLFTRQGEVEMDFYIPELSVSVAEAIQAVEKASPGGRRFLAPIARQIIDCNLLGG